MSQESAMHYLRHGQMPFFRLPTAIVSPPKAGTGAIDAVVMGVPYDAGTTYQPGARFGPFHVRRVSALIQPYHPYHQIDVFETLRVVDGGNVAFPPFDPPAVRDLIASEVGRIAETGAAPFLVGGDHSITLPALRAVAGQHGPVAVIHVDAHADTSSGELWGYDYHHGTPIRHALNEGLIAALVQIGLRGPWNHRDDDRLVRERGGHRYPMEAVEERGIRAVMSEVASVIGGRPVYISFDLDAVDPAFAPGTGTPVPGGLSSREALAIVRALAGQQIVGMDVVEISPPQDHADMTCHLAAHLVFEGLAALAKGR